MSAPTPFVRSKYRTLEGGCVSCSGDLATVQSLPGVQNVDALASGVVLVTHDAGPWFEETLRSVARRETAERRLAAEY